MGEVKPLTRFLLAVCHSQELMAAFNDLEQRGSVLQEWRLQDHPLFTEGEVTAERVREAVASEQGVDTADVGTAFWIWFFSGPKRPDWVWSPQHDDPDDDDDGNGADTDTDGNGDDDGDDDGGPFGGGG
jgi:hypothetical protein